MGSICLACSVFLRFLSAVKVYRFNLFIDDVVNPRVCVAKLFGSHFQLFY